MFSILAMIDVIDMFLRKKRQPHLPVEPSPSPLKTINSRLPSEADLRMIY